MPNLGVSWKTWFFRYGISALLGTAMVFCVAMGARYEREFRTSLEQGFQHRVELGDLASSVQQLRRILESPRALDQGYIAGLIERTKEVEAKSKAQIDAGRIGELILPSKELAAIAAMQQGFERLAASAAQLERAQNLKLALKPAEPADTPAIKRVSALIDDYVNATAGLRSARSASNALSALQQATMGLGENLAAATNESRRKTVPQGWRDVLSLLPAERGDLVDRLLADGRMLEDLQSQRARATSRLEQVAAKIDSAERLLLQSRAGGGLLVVAAILTWSGVGMGLLALLIAAFQIRRYSLAAAADSSVPVEVMVPRSILAEEQDEDRASEEASAEAILAARIATEANRVALSSGSLTLTDNHAAREKVSVRELAEAAVDDHQDSLEAVTSGYWIAAGSMAERRVALLDRQSDQLEQHVKSLMASAETLAGRVDMVVQSVQLSLESDQDGAAIDLTQIRQRLESLQTLAMNLSLQVSAGENSEPVLEDLERFSEALDAVSSEMKQFNNPRSQGVTSRRMAVSLDEVRRLAAVVDTLKERTETLYEDAQRFRRHSEALIRGIQEGAVAELPSSYLRTRGIGS
jgi:Na+-transporting methylmalonyl-CoA/oxaloacetate decarboxylase gamma subunit